MLASLVLSNACVGGSRRLQQPGPASAAQQDARMRQVYDLLKADRPDEAGVILKQILQSDPENRRARIELTYLHIRSKRWKEALALLDSLLDEDPTDMRLRMERGYVRQAMGEPYEAADEFRIVMRESDEFHDQARDALKEVEYEASPAAREITSTTLINEGYEDLKRGEKTAARAKFMEALFEVPGSTEVTKQLGYMNVADGNSAAALDEFAGVHRLTPLDYESALELGYLYESLHDESGSKKAFAAALLSPDPKIHGEAAAALKEIYGRTDPLYLDVNASPYYTSRFGDYIANAEVIAGYRPDWAGPLSFYFASRYNQDSLSHSGAAPVVFDDNYVSFAPGLRLQPRGFDVTLTAEYGPAVNLILSSDHPNKVEYDGRVVLADYHYWGGPLRTFADAGGSVGYYSRYQDDVIGQLQLRAGFKAWDNNVSQVTLYAPVNVIKDSNLEFYNNLVEIGGGMEFQPWTKVNLKIRAEFLRGTYMRVQGVDENPYGPQYNDLRITLVYSGHFTKQRKPEEFPPKPRSPVVW
jgi:Flp pilus assembly protein TadD